MFKWRQVRCCFRAAPRCHGTHPRLLSKHDRADHSSWAAEGGLAAAWAKEAGPRGRTTTHETATHESELLINALKGASSLDVIPNLPDSHVDGKIMIDIGNDLVFPGGGVKFATLEAILEVSVKAPWLDGKSMECRVAKGIFKSNGRVQVSFRRHKAPVSETNYVAKGYQPPLKDVPTEEQFKASRKGGGPSEPAKLD